MKLAYLFLLSLSVFAQSGLIEQNFNFIKDLIDRKQVREAQRQIDILRVQNENNPTLDLYQTEIWIEIGERNYREGNLKTAFDNFKKAYEVYPSNPLVNSRYKELSGRALFDQGTENGFKNALSFYPMGLQGSLNAEYLEKENNKEAGTGLSTSELLLAIICAQNFVLLAFHLLRRK